MAVPRTSSRSRSGSRLTRFALLPESRWTARSIIPKTKISCWNLNPACSIGKWWDRQNLEWRRGIKLSSNDRYMRISALKPAKRRAELVYEELRGAVSDVPEGADRLAQLLGAATAK